MSPRVLSRVTLGLAAALLLVGALIGFTPVDVSTGVTSTASCGAPWSPTIGPDGPLLETITTPEQCSAATFPLALVAAVLAGLGVLALFAWLMAHWLIASMTAQRGGTSTVRVNLGPRRNPKGDND